MYFYGIVAEHSTDCIPSAQLCTVSGGAYNRNGDQLYAPTPFPSVKKPKFKTLESLKFQGFERLYSLILISDPFKGMFSEFVTVEIRVEGNDLVNGTIERRTRHHGGEHVIDGFYILFRQPIMVEGKGRTTVKDGLTDFLLTATVILSVSVFGHSNPPYKAR